MGVVKEPVTTLNAQILVLMHVAKVLNVEPEIMELFAHVHGAISEIQQLPVVQTEIADLAANAVAAMLLEFLDTEDSSKISSLHFTKTNKYQKTVPLNAD